MGYTVAGYVAEAVASTAASYGVSKLTAPGRISIPPPPGAAMVDQAGQSAAAATRRRQAAAGGLQSTITGAGAPPPSGTGGPTAGAKSQLGV